jgi:hypothetical protein
MPSILRLRLRFHFARVVTDVLRGDHEDDVLGDVGGVIADALEMTGDQDEVGSWSM